MQVWVWLHLMSLKSNRITVILTNTIGEIVAYHFAIYLSGSKILQIKIMHMFELDDILYKQHNW